MQARACWTYVGVALSEFDDRDYDQQLNQRKGLDGTAVLI